jgi:hypothetical protein
MNDEVHVCACYVDHFGSRVVFYAASVCCCIFLHCLPPYGADDEGNSLNNIEVHPRKCVLCLCRCLWLLTVVLCRGLQQHFAYQAPGACRCLAVGVLLELRVLTSYL